MEMNEKLGVPMFIYDLVENLYHNIIDDIEDGISKAEFQKDILNYQIHINTLNIKQPFNNIDVLVSVRKITAKNENDKNAKIILGGAYIPNKDRKDVFIKLELGVEESLIDGGSLKKVNSLKIKKIVLDGLEENKKLIFNVLNHEIKHAYDFLKNDKLDTDNDVYINGIIRKFMIEEENIGKFVFNIYYSLVFENMTRPSELYSDLINNGITKSNFLSHIKKTDIYQNLKYMENFDKDKFISSIDMNNKEIKEIVKISGVENNPKALLEFMVERMKDLIIDFVIEQNYDNLFFESVFHPEKIKKDVKNIEKRFKMFKNSEKFLDFIEKRFKFVANDTLRKISKTWDLLKNDKNSDIMDKINKKTSSEVKNENQWINQKALKYINTFDVKNWMPSKKGNGGNGDNQIL